MTPEQIAWAKKQPWFRQDNGDGTIVVDGIHKCGGTFCSFEALKSWAEKQGMGMSFTAMGIIDSSGRKAVSAQSLYDNPDIQGYLFFEENADVGCDPWVIIGGMDSYKDGSKIVIEWGSSGEIHVDPDFMVYVSKDEYCITNEEKSDQYWLSQ